LINKLVDEINNVFFDELQTSQIDVELINELKNIIIQSGNVNDLLEILEKYSK
jgi:hypothetical protein